MKPTWEKPKSTKLYLHAPGANRIIMIHPDAKITNLALKNDGRHANSDACGVHLLTGKDEMSSLDHTKTRFDTPHNGLPFYTLHATDEENGCHISMSAFATNDDEPLTYVRITLENTENHTVSGTLGLLPREVENGDRYLIGTFDTGYESYRPNINQWYIQSSLPFVRVSPMIAEAPSAELRILSSEGFSVRWISRGMQPHRFRAHDYFACDYTLDAGNTASLDFVLSATPIMGAVNSYDLAYSLMNGYWHERLSRITRLPQSESARIHDMYLASVTQCLQMLSRYEGLDGVFVRQGDIGRFFWIWEGIHVLRFLSDIGYADDARAVYDTLCSRIIVDGDARGKIDYPYVAWDNSEGALMLGICELLKTTNSKELFRHYRPYLSMLFDCIERSRHADTDAVYPGLYPPTIASEKGERGYFWIFTDAFVLRAMRSYVEVCTLFEAEELTKVRSAEENYTVAVSRVMDDLYKGHENNDAFIFPHIAGVSFEDSFHSLFSVYGAPFLSLIGMLDPHSRKFEQMERFYIENGLFEHGLAGRITNAVDLGTYAYGDCYYIGIPEFSWIYPWMARGEWDKVEAMTDALLRYGVTSEYAVSERYASVDAWYVPWQPNGSGSARLGMFLLDYNEYKKSK